MSVKMRYSIFWRFEDSPFAENWVMTDDFDVMRQVGVDPLAQMKRKKEVVII